MIKSVLILTKIKREQIFSIRGTMDILAMVNWIYIGVSSLALFLALVLLVIAFIQSRRCLDFPTLLTGNTILGATIFSGNSLSVAIYMYLLDKQLAPDFLSNCPLRAYFHHSALAWVHHSLALHALQKYCSIKRVRLLDSTFRKFCLVFSQWIFDFTFILPVFLTGNIVKISIENVCLVSFSRPELLFSVGGIIFFLPDVVIMYLYGSLVLYVRKASARITGSQRIRMNRDMAMVRRIVMLHCALLLFVLPALVAMIMGTIRIELLPHRLFRVFCLVTVISTVLMLIILFWITPKLRNLICEQMSRAELSTTTKRVRVTSILND